MSSQPSSEVTLTQPSMPILRVPSQSTGTEGEDFTIFDVERLFVPMGGIHSIVTLECSSEDYAQPDTHRRYRLVEAKVDADPASMIGRSFSTDVAGLADSYAGVNVNPWPCTIMTGFTSDGTQRVDAVLPRCANDNREYTPDVPFVVTQLGVSEPRQSLSLAKDYLTLESGNAIAAAGGFLLRAPGMDDIQMSSISIEDKAIPLIVDFGSHPSDGTALLRSSSATISAADDKGGKIIEGVTSWSRPVDSSSKPSIFDCNLQPAVWIRDTMIG